MKIKSLLDLKLIALDVDGVLTDGRYYYSNKGLAFRSYSSRDGTGIHMLIKSGLTVALISTNNAIDTKIRARDLGINHVYLGVEQKDVIIRDLRKRLNIEKKHTLFMGDDVWDIPAFLESGIAVTVPEASKLVKRYANWVTKSPGGNGAVREIVDEILRIKRVNPLDLLGFGR